MAHSLIVGGSTAKRVMACPASVALVAKMPPKPSSVYADRGILLHNAISDVLGNDAVPHTLVGTEYNGEVLTEDLLDEKLLPALAALEKIDPENKMDYAVETVVGFGKYLPGVFGSADFLGRVGNRAVVLDWKFGDGVAVEVEENEQLMFYAAAAMRTPEAEWVFKDATEIECVIVQPPAIKRWVTTPERIKKFERELKRAVKLSAAPDAKFEAGEHCRWCAAKPICPKMTGAVDRALKAQIANLDAPTIGAYLGNADLLEDWIKDLRALAMQMMENGAKVPGYKLVAKRSVRKWLDESKAADALASMGIDPWKKEVLSPAQAEKALKPMKKALPDDMVAAVSSGTTFAPDSDPRPEVLQVGQQLTAALSKLV
jgi:hypothetical protein